MTVNELVEILGTYPKDLRVFFDAPYYDMIEVDKIKVKQIEIEDYDPKTKSLVYPVKLKALVFESC